MSNTREEYNKCMSPYMSGSKTKEQRQLDMCLGAKLCSQKAKTKEEAERMCNVAKLPKWVIKQIGKDEEKTPCKDRMNRVKNNIDVVILKVKEGSAEEVKDAVAQIVADFYACRKDEEETLNLVTEVADEFNTLSKGFYFKGEAKDLVNNLETIKELAG